MLPHQGYSRLENPKRHGFDSSIKLSILQNYGIMNLQNHGLSDNIPGVLSLPWELLHDEQGFLALHTPRPVSLVRRFPATETTGLSTPFVSPLRVLLITARPEGIDFVDPRGIAHELLDELQDQIQAGAVVLEFLRPPTLFALHARLKNTEQPVHVLHFDGHGAFDERIGEQGILIFETDAGWPGEVKASDLAKVLRDSGVRLAVLTACQSAMGSTKDAFSSVSAHGSFVN